jgi:hypothetical protein
VAPDWSRMKGGLSVLQVVILLGHIFHPPSMSTSLSRDSRLHSFLLVVTPNTTIKTAGLACTRSFYSFFGTIRHHSNPMRLPTFKVP